MTNPNFWECGCAVRYIHPKSKKRCDKCGAVLANDGDFPDANQEELEDLYQLVWWKPGNQDTHATLDGMRTVCGKDIPPVNHPAHYDERLECQKCKDLIYPGG